MRSDFNGTMTGLNRIWDGDFSQTLVADCPPISRIKWEKLPSFSRTEIQKLPSDSAIYAFVWTHMNVGINSPVRGENIVYIGQARRLKERLLNYGKKYEEDKGAEKRKKILSMVKQCPPNLDVYVTRVLLQYLRV